MARLSQSLDPLLREHKDEGSLTEMSQSSYGQAVHEETAVLFLSLLFKLPSRCQSSKAQQRQRMVLCPSPPSGAACCCQDFSLHIVMKGVIKVTAGWNVAYSASVLKHATCLFLTSNYVCQLEGLVVSNQAVHLISMGQC